MARVLVTGGAGFIGSHLVRRLLAQNDDVHILARPTSNLDRIASGVSQAALHLIDTADGAALDQLVRDIQPEIVFHLASNTRRAAVADLSDVQDSIQSDLGLLMRLLSACSALPHPLKTFVRAGTLAEYGGASPPFQESQLALPLNTYAASMLAGTQYLQMLQNRLNFPAVTGRLALTYGAGQSKDFLIPSMINKCKAGLEIELKHPEDTRDLIYIEDVIGGLIALSRCPQAAGEVMNIATGKTHKMRDVAALVLQSTGADSRLLKCGTPDQSSGMPDFRTSTLKADKVLNWRAETSLGHGLEQTLLAELSDTE